jgi:hypothetical protein
MPYPVPLFHAPDFHQVIFNVLGGFQKSPRGTRGAIIVVLPRVITTPVYPLARLANIPTNVMVSPLRVPVPKRPGLVIPESVSGTIVVILFFFLYFVRVKIPPQSDRGMIGKRYHDRLSHSVFLLFHLDALLLFLWVVGQTTLSFDSNITIVLTLVKQKNEGKSNKNVRYPW